MFSRTLRQRQRADARDPCRRCDASPEQRSPGEFEAALDHHEAPDVALVVGAERGEHLGADPVELIGEPIDIDAVTHVGDRGRVDRSGTWFRRVARRLGGRWRGGGGDVGMVKDRHGCLLVGWVLEAVAGSTGCRVEPVGVDAGTGTGGIGGRWCGKGSRRGRRVRGRS
jgi:hypothetical protein